jgi:hypothetical protein
MIKPSLLALLALLALVVLAATPSPARADWPAGPRSATAILADAVTALGGQAAIEGHKTIRMKLDVTFQGMGIAGTVERVATNAGKMLVTTDVPGNGTSREGTDGSVFWADDPINGLRAVTGAEAELLRIDASFCPEAHATELYKSVEVAADKGADGAPLECLILTPREGSAMTNCYDAKTHLQVTQKGTHTTPQGESPFTTTLKDYRDVGGVKIAYGMDTKEGPFTFTMRVTEVKLDVPLDDKTFEMPRTDAASAKGGQGKGKKSKAKTKTVAKPKDAPKP